MEKKYFDAAVLKAELDGYVLGQDEGVRRVALAVSSHLYRISAHKRNRNSLIRKDNVLLAGPTGCGKTETFRVLRRLEEKLGIPVIMRNAPDYIPNESWKGEKVLTLLARDLCKEALDLYSRLYHAPRTDKDFKDICQMASNGIIMLDEFDKIRIVDGTTSAIFCRDYQATLLKMTEGSEYPAGRAVFKNGTLEDQDADGFEMKVDTSGVMFVFLGAFEGIKEITRCRLLQERREKKGGTEQETKTMTGNMGFTAEIKPAGRPPASDEELPAGTDLTPNLEDMIEYGIMRELAGRITIRINYKELSEANIIKIMKESKTSVYHEYQERFENMGHRLTLDNYAFWVIAGLAKEQETGARGLSNIFGDLLSDVMYTLSGTAEPMECVLCGFDIRENRSPLLRRIHPLRQNEMNGNRGA